MRKKGVAHEEAFRGVLARVLVSPAFLFRIETAAAGQGARPGQRLGTGHAAQLLPLVVAARRRAARSSPPRASSATRRSSPSRRSGCSRTTALRALAIEFGTQWIHVRGFDELKEKNEKLFPTFDADAPQGDLRGIDPVLPGPVPERPPGDARFSTPTTRSSTKRWRSTTASPA